MNGVQQVFYAQGWIMNCVIGFVDVFLRHAKQMRSSTLYGAYNYCWLDYKDMLGN